MSGPWDIYAAMEEDDAAEGGPWDLYESIQQDRSPAKTDEEPQSVRQPLNDLVSSVGRQTGLAARHAVRGVTTIPAMVGDAANALINMGTGAINRATGTEIPRLQSVSGVRDQALDAALPKPEGAAERIVGAASEAAAGGFGLPAAAKWAGKQSEGLIRRGMEKLSEAPMAQGASGASAGAASQLAAEEGAGAVGQAAAALAGGMAPFAPGAAAESLRRAFRGGEEGRRTVAQNIADFERSGTLPTISQATQTRRSQYWEALASRYPGGSGRMSDAYQGQATATRDNIDRIVEDLASGADPTAAGVAIKSGVAKYVSDYKARTTQMYAALDPMFASSSVAPTNTIATLRSLTAPIRGAEPLSEGFLRSETVVRLQDQVGRSLAPDGTIPYEALKRVRTEIGEMLDPSSLLVNPDSAKLKRLYAALSDDMESAAKAAGPKAEKAYAEVNKYVRDHHRMIDDLLEPIVSKRLPEEIYLAATGPSMKHGATQIKAIMDSLEPEQQKILSATFIRQMGSSVASRQNAAVDEFSFSTFLSNWAKMSPEARKVMFDRPGYGSMADDLDAIARTAESVRRGAQAFSNPSGTAQAQAAASVAGGGAVAIGTGNFGVAAGILASVGAANGSARLMTNPKFVKWLAKASTVPASAVPAQINNLISLSRRESLEDQADIWEFIDQVGQRVEIPEGAPEFEEGATATKGGQTIIFSGGRWYSARRENGKWVPEK